MRRVAAAAAVAVLLAGCGGTVPERDAPPEFGMAAVLLGTRLLLPGGESQNGLAEIDLESKEQGPDAEIYRLPLRAAEANLFRIEPGLYRLAPTRSAFGSTLDRFAARIEDRVYRLPFPRELMRPTYEARPRKVAVLGVLEVRVLPALPGQPPQVRVRLDDAPATRRELVQQMIRSMMDPRHSANAREGAIAWSHALQEALVSVLAEEEHRPLYQSAP